MVEAKAALPPRPQAKQVRKKPAERSEEILSTACGLIIREGYASFSLRQVADAVGVKLATLQYYYPTREALLTATVKRSLQGWRQGYAEIADDESLSAEERVRAILQRNVDYILEEPETVLLFDVFAMARRESFISGMIEKLYLQYRQMFMRLFMEIGADISKADAMAIASVVTSQMEGLVVFGAPQDPIRANLDALRETIDGFANWVVMQVKHGHRTGPGGRTPIPPGARRT